MLRVGDVISACEYINCEVLDALGDKIEVTKENSEVVYAYSVEHLSAKDNQILIWTFVNWSKFQEQMIAEAEALKRKDSE